MICEITRWATEIFPLPRCQVVDNLSRALFILEAHPERKARNPIDFGHMMR